MTNAQHTKRRQARQGYAIIFLIAAAMMVALTGAYHVDQARGISVDQSLSSVGL